MRNTFHVTVRNWEKHNPIRKKGYTHFLFHSGFFTDEKISQLSKIETLLFIYCLCIAAEKRSNSFTIHAKLLPKSLRISDKLLEISLTQLQLFQLVSYEKNSFLKKRIEKKRIEEKRIEEKRREEKVKKGNEQIEFVAVATLSAPPELPELARLWNENCAPLPKIKIATAARAAAIKKAWPLQTSDDWIKTIRRLAASDFCTGKSGTWTASFDWLIKKDNWVKVNEGNYDNGRSFAKTRATQVYDNLDRLEQEWMNKEPNERGVN